MRDLFTLQTIIQGEIAISGDPDVVLGTLLGSCISVCMYDPFARVGGMNHFLLPGEGCNEGANDAMFLFGATAMDSLIKGIIDAGGDRSRLLCKAFGGAAVLSVVSDVGRENIAFLLDYVRKENIHCVSYSLGGRRVRRIRFWPTTGKVLQNKC